MNFLQKLEQAIKKNNSLVCVGLDPDLDKIPSKFREFEDPIFEFNKSIIDQTHDLVCAFKPNIAFYAAEGPEGLESLTYTIEYIKEKYPEIPIILDAKRGDIGSTSEKYAQEIFDTYNADAVTVSPYLGYDGVEPFLKYKEKGIIVLCRTSNLGAKDFQDLLIDGEPLYTEVAKKVVEWNTQYGNCLIVVGSTWPMEVKRIREIAPEMFFLVPGIGSQGGDLEKTLKNGLTKEKSGLIMSVSRAIIYAENPRAKTEKLRNQINEYR